MLKYSEVFEEVRQIVSEILALELEEIKPECRFFEDLGGESIDVLELTFQCEKRFNTKVKFQEMASLDLATNEDGSLTRESLAAMERRYPYLDYSKFKTNPQKSRIAELLTVAAIAQALHHAMDQGAIRTGVDSTTLT